MSATAKVHEMNKDKMKDENLSILQTMLNKYFNQYFTNNR